DRDLTVDGERMMVARHEQCAAERRLDARKAREPARPLADAAARIELDAEPAGAPDVVEEALIRQRARADEQDIVVVRRPEDRRGPAKSVAAAAHTGLERLRDDLLERRICDERIRQAARIVLVRTSELDRRRRTVRLAVARIERQVVRQSIREPQRRIEAIELVPPVESRAEQVAELDPGLVE